MDCQYILLNKNEMGLCGCVNESFRTGVKDRRTKGPVCTSPLAYSAPTSSRSQRGPAKLVSDARSVVITVVLDFRFGLSSDAHGDSTAAGAILRIAERSLREGKGYWLQKLGIKLLIDGWECWLKEAWREYECLLYQRRAGLELASSAESFSSLLRMSYRDIEGLAP